MRSGTLIRVTVGVLFILILAQGVQAAAPPAPPSRYSFVTEWTFFERTGEPIGSPYGIAIDSKNNWVYVGDHSASRIQKFDTDGKPEQWVTYPADNWGIDIDKYGIVYTDGNVPNKNKYIDKYDSNGNLIESIAEGQLSGTRDLAVDKDGNIYVAEWSTNKIRKYNKIGTPLLSWGAPGTGDGQFNGPEGVAVDSTGNFVYVTDHENNRVQKFDNTGKFLLKWGTKGSNRDGKFNGPEGITVDKNGYVYVSDASNYQIQKFDSSGQFITRWGTFGETRGNFTSPSGIAVDSAKNVYVSDSSRNKILKFAQTNKAEFKGVPTEGQIPLGETLNVQFTDMSTGSPTGWYWDFGDETTSTLPNPSHNFAPDADTGGLKTYTITLKVTWPGGVTDQEIKTQYITVTTQLIKPAVIELVKEAENQLYPDGLPEDISVSACEQMLTPGSCVQTYGCDCNKPPGTLVSEGEKPGCSRVPSCKDPASQPALIFIDNGYVNIGTVETPKWKPANFMHGCQIAYQCSGENIIPSSVDCASPVLDCGATYADGLNPPPDGLGPVNDPPTPWSPTCGQNCNKYYALLIAGGIDKTQNEKRYWNDIAFVYNTLIEYGYDKTHITVLMSDGYKQTVPGTYDADRHIAKTGTASDYDNSPFTLEGTGDTTNDVTGDATKTNIINTLTNYASGTTTPPKLPSDATLFIFTTGHGGTYKTGDTRSSNTVTYYTWGNDFITDDDFVAKLNEINVKNITMVMEQCYGGGFRDEFMLEGSHSTGGTYGLSQKRVLITASDWYEPSWANGFSNAWTKGVAAHDRDAVVPFTPDFSADVVTWSPFVKDQRVSTKESYEYVFYTNPKTSQLNDPFALRPPASPPNTAPALDPGKEHPQLFYKSTDPWAQFLNDCTASVLKTITVKGPTLTTPVTSWPAKSHQYIFWDATGFATTDKVKITLVNDTGARETIIAPEVHAINDSYEWNQIDGIGATGTKFKIRIDSIGISPSVSGTGGYFTITYPALTTGKLQLNSVPTGAKITGDSGFNAQTGTLTATTNTLISNLRPGNYYVTVSGVTDYNDKTSMVNIPGNGGTRTFEFKMLKVDGSNSPGNAILISIEPNDPEDDLGDGAEIWIREISGDFAQIPGETTSAYLERDGGKYEIYVTKDGWITPQTQEVELPAYDSAIGTQYVDVTFKLDPKIQSTIPPIPNSQVSVGETATDTATVTGDSIYPTGTVTFKLFGPSTSVDCNSPAIYEITKDLASGSASCSYIPETAGSYYWLASYSGDDNYLASTTACGYTGVTVLPAATSTELASSKNPSTYGDSIKFTATVSNTAGSVPPAGSVQFKIDDSDFGSAVTLTDGEAISGEISSLTAGSHPVKAVFTDTASNFGTSEKSIAQGVNQATTTITWAKPADITYGTALDGTQLGATASVPGSFVYTPASGVLSAGNDQNLHVDFTPTDTTNYNGASADVKINVLPATTSVSSAAQTLVTAGGIATDTATLAGGYNPTGSIIFTLYGPSDTAICSEPNKVFTSVPVTVNGNGNYVSLGYTTKAVGTYRWIAEYSGDTNNNGFKTKCGDAGETLTVDYIFNGFFPPIDMINVNIFDTKKTPPTIPLKWYLADGNGPVSDTARFDGVFTQEVKCDSFGDPQTPQLESSPGGSGLQTPVNGNWQYNWAIKKSYSTHCKIMFVQFTNGQTSKKVKYKFI